MSGQKLIGDLSHRIMSRGMNLAKEIPSPMDQETNFLFKAVRHIDLASSYGEARRLVRRGVIRVNGSIERNELMEVSKIDIITF
ncbi:hypothetical protein AA12717_0277 [Gluconacetobacter sacchari DSM 12717]|uniref:RNA-binding S4 domain-containing protein n=2 Tax=Gluconacetobacter sacchari TaxID=92759 RepID=A0A7W4IAR1_9PROT|nr:hypothetical protein [Gluconacetobacter sacchari]MBB2159362.1 hypothetical protein [Gluconacetobacter sacchari]GBQ19514.1 hypothetical protein AA12717_0277 [Gluconacetobacter sacchari DSM 12717]